MNVRSVDFVHMKGKKHIKIDVGNNFFPGLTSELATETLQLHVE